MRPALLTKYLKTCWHMSLLALVFTVGAFLCGPDMLISKASMNIQYLVVAHIVKSSIAFLKQNASTYIMDFFKSYIVAAA